MKMVLRTNIRHIEEPDDTAPSPPSMSAVLRERPATSPSERFLAQTRSAQIPVSEDVNVDPEDDDDIETAPSPPHMSVFFQERRARR